ncbi:MAG TPA: fatty acyl-AMP ligase [Anaeromyxobacteraceae bacterium]|nr:fatty acyl-AMP ligase [Anaeromyxobacteraceae bacterium]
MKGPPAPAPRHLTVNAALAAAARHPCGATFVDLREREVYRSWREVREAAREVAGGLARLGVRPGDRVALVYRTEPDFLSAFFGVLLAGGVPVPLYPPVRLGRLEEYLAATARMLQVSGARLLLAAGSVRRLLGEAVAGARPELGCRGLDGLPAGGPLEREVGPEALALVQFSSGSTVDPKPVALTHAALAAQGAALLALVRPTPADVLVSWLPLYHDMGLIGGLLSAVSYPGPAVLIPPEHFLARPALWLRAVARHRGTVCAAPSFAYSYAEARIPDAELQGHDLSSWRVALDGAEPVSAEVLRRFAERFARFGLDPRALRPVYGLSEAALAVTFTRGDWPPATVRLDPARLARDGVVAPGAREVASVGEPIPGVELEVRGEGGAPLPEDRLGRIFVRGPSLMREYLGDEEATRRALPGGWLDTGDLGFAHEGELYVHGRAKDLVIVRGANRAPEEFEASLAGVAGLRAGCAVALGFVPEGGEGEELLILAEVERSRGGTPGGPGAIPAPALEEAVRRAVLERTGISPHTVALLAPGTLPRTSSGKLRRGEALRRWLAGELAPPAPVNAFALARAFARSSLGYARARRAPTAPHRPGDPP